MITASKCKRQATLYRDKAKAEPCIGMRKALLNLNCSWIAIAEQIERLDVVRDINNLLLH
jgi:hypothetical protein